MRALLMLSSLVFLGAGLAACSGGSGFHCLAGDVHCHDPLTTYWVVQAVPAYQVPAAPIAVGASIDIVFQEQRCASNSSESGPPPGAGCGSWSTPSVVFGNVQPLQGTGAPCPVTVSETGPGRLHFTRTGPGDPALKPFGNTVGGYCLVHVYTANSAQTQSGPYDVYL